jgi:Ca2+-binding RTX toxin-like protein
VENTAPVTVTRNAENNATRFTITPSTGENVETLTVDPTTLEDGDQPIFEVQDGVSNSAPVAISFNLIEESTTPINLNTATEGGGTIASNAPSGIDFNFNGVYFNSAAGSDEITGSSFDDFIRAGAGDDIINTGAGNDLIRSGAGNDIITTGDGDDLIYYTADQLDGTTDRVLDFSASDRIVLGENIRASLSGNIATFITTIDGVDRQATLSFEGSSVLPEERFLIMS